MLTETATLAATDETGDIHLSTGLREGEIRGAQTNLRVWAEHLLGKAEQYLLQVGEAYVLVDIESFYLVEEAVGTSCYRLVTIHTTRADDADDTDDEAELFFLSDYALNELATLDAEETEENAQARTRAAQCANTSNEAVSTIGQGLAGGVTRQNIASVSTAQTFYDNTRASLDKAGLKEYFNPNDNGIFTPEKTVCCSAVENVS